VFSVLSSSQPIGCRWLRLSGPATILADSKGLCVVRTLLDGGGFQPAGAGRTQPLIGMCQR